MLENEKTKVSEKEAKKQANYIIVVINDDRRGQ